MSQGRSIHIGVNEGDPNHYGSSAPLAGCENDAKDMEAIARDSGFTHRRVLLTRDATSVALLRELAEAAGSLTSGDTLLVTFAGHGSQVRDASSEESDALDETWCLHDRMLVDDELWTMWSRFLPGVRIVVVSDSCHSGTVSRAFYADVLSRKRGPGSTYRDAEVTSYRLLPDEAQKFAEQNSWDLYAGIQHLALRSWRSTVHASVLLMSACQDHQLAGDGPANGLFTGHLKSVWDGGRFAGDYRAFVKSISDSMRQPLQLPNFSVEGVPNAMLESEKPFTLRRGAVAPTWVAGASRCTLEVDAPVAAFGSGSREEIRLFLMGELCEAVAVGLEKLEPTCVALSPMRSRGEFSAGCKTDFGKDHSCHADLTIRF